jgi:hypothetical protein
MFSEVRTTNRRGRFVRSVVERLNAHSINREDCMCNEFVGARNLAGYGRISVGGRSTLAHRAAYAAMIGPIPNGKFVLHRCDNPPCVNPQHLFIGDHAANAADKVAKGRQSRGDAHGITMRGEKNGSSKLDADCVSQIRRLCASGRSQKRVADFFGVSQPTVSQIVNHKRWNFVP